MGNTRVDWATLQQDYEQGSKSIRRLATDYGVSDAAIRKHAKKHGWKAKPETTETNAFKFSAPVRQIVATTRPEAEDIVDRGVALAARMLDELDATTTREGELTQMIGEATDGDDNHAKRDAMLRAVSLPSRATTLKTLALAVKTFKEAEAAKGKKAAARDAAMSAEAGTLWDGLLVPADPGQDRLN